MSPYAFTQKLCNTSLNFFKRRKRKNGLFGPFGVSGKDKELFLILENLDDRKKGHD